MLAENSAYIKIMSDYSQMRSFAESKCQKRREEVYKQVPEIEEIDRKIKDAGLENMGKILKNPEKSDEYNTDLDKKIKILLEKRNSLLDDNNIERDFDKPVYGCKKCNDTGYVDGKKCPCLKQRLIDYAYEISNMKTLINTQTFENFDMCYYGDTKIKNMNMTERENIEDIVNICINFCKSPENSKNLLFYGMPGLGKTFLSSAVAKEMLDKGYTVIYTGASKLFSAYDDYRFGRMSNPDDFEDMLKFVYDADLLIIDDLGVEMHGPSAFQFLFDLINERILKNRRMIISTNLTMEEISKTYTSRITSRLYENFNCLRFVGKDIRTQKLIREKQKQ